MSCKAYESTGTTPIPEGYLTRVRPDHTLDELLLGMAKPLRSIPFRSQLKELLLASMPLSRIYHWVAAGVYYGYPQHCIEAFLARATVRITQQGTPEELICMNTDFPEAQPYESSGCIPSETLLNLPVAEGLALINQHRFAPVPFTSDMDDITECRDLEELMEAKPEYRTAFITTLRNILEKE